MAADLVKLPTAWLVATWNNPSGPAAWPICKNGAAAPTRDYAARHRLGFKESTSEIEARHRIAVGRRHGRERCMARFTSIAKERVKGAGRDDSPPPHLPQSLDRDEEPPRQFRHRELLLWWKHPAAQPCLCRRC